LCLGARDHGSIHVQGDAGLASGGGGVRAHAADKNLGHVEVVTERDGRHDELQVFEVGDVRILETIRADRAHRSAHVLQGLFAFLRGNHDLLQLLGERWRGENQTEDAGPQTTSLLHDSSLECGPAI
jgi:hypothetical protein